MREIKDSWLKEYLRFTKNQESPEDFHLWVALGLLATALNRQVYHNHGHFNVYPNLYIILVAKSQLCRKSSALSIGIKLMNQLPANLKPRISSQKLTPEALIESLYPDARKSATGAIQAISSSLFYADELTTLIDKQARNAGMLGLLVNLYDCPEKWSYRTKARGEEELMKVYCNMLAGSSPEYLRTSMPYDEIGGGMLARTIFVYRNKPKRRIAFPEISQEEEESRLKLLHDLAEIKKLQGVVKITPDAREWYESWYTGVDTADYRPDIAPYLHKKEILILKIGQLFSIAENDSLVVEKKHLQLALKTLEENEKYLPNVMGELLASEAGYRNQQVLTAIRDIIMLGKKPTRAAITRKLCHALDSNDIAKSLETLQEAEIIRHKVTTTAGGSYYEVIT
jgi:hypothetical protein